MVGVNIDKNGFAIFPYNAASSCNVRKRCSDDLSGKPECLDGKLKRDGAVINGENILNTQKTPQLGFKFQNDWAAISEPFSVPDLFQSYPEVVELREKCLCNVYHPLGK